jgi:predicted membrane protein
MSKYEELWRVAWTILFLVFLLVVVLSTAETNHVVIYDSKEANLGELLLVAATLVITCLAVMLAVGALWGYRELRDAAIAAATKAAETEARTTATKVAQTVVRRSKFETVDLEDGTSPEEAQQIAAAQDD